MSVNRSKWILCLAGVVLLLVGGCKKRPPTSLSSPAPRTSPGSTSSGPPLDVPSPTVSIKADPGTIQRGNQTNLSWQSTRATTLVIDGGVGTVATNGELVLTPLESTTYTAIANGPGGEARASTRVTVVVRSGEADITATDIDHLEQAIQEGRIRPIFFDYDQAVLSEESRRILQENARVLKQFGDVRVVIEGHCDERGSEEYNLALGDRRAQATKDYLLELGVDGKRLVTVSYGEERPFVQGYDENAWRLNRRAHFQVDRF